MNNSELDRPTNTSFIHNAHTATFNGGNFTVAETVHNNVNHVARLSQATNPIDLLLSYCALDALVNSNERYDPPKCAPDTRDAIITEIVAWANSSYQAPSVLWLNGSAGAGKSAVCQTVAEIFLQKKILLGSFFFSRTVATSGRSNGDRLFPTLIYQLFQAYPETRQLIEEDIRKDPAVLVKSRHFQMTALFVKPLQAFSWRKVFRSLSRKQIRLVVIDGLDECQDPEVQCDILRIIASVAADLSSVPLRFLISSRPEAHISQTFDNPKHFKSIAIRRINLDQDPKASISIMAFLREAFKEIRETHPQRQHLDESWPGEHVLELLVAKSSPQFVYASTVMKYVQSTKHLPSLRLQAILNLASPMKLENDSIDDQPFAELDRLYRFIFLGVEAKHRATVWCLLGVVSLAGNTTYACPTPNLPVLERMLNVHKGLLRIMLEPLLAVLHIPDDDISSIKSLHASLFDFLLDRHRSGDLALDLAPAHLSIMRHHILIEIFDNFPLIGPGSPLSLFRRVLLHAQGIHVTSEGQQVVDDLLSRLFSKILYGENSSLDTLKALEESFNVLLRLKARDFSMTADGNTDPWVINRLLYYQQCLPDFAIPSGKDNPFTSVLLRTKHCVYLKISRHHFHPEYKKLSFATLFNELALVPIFEVLIPYLHLAAAFCADSRVTEWLQFIHSVGALLWDKELDSDDHVDLITGCQDVILNALRNGENVERNDDHAQAVAAWSNVKVEGGKVVKVVNQSNEAVGPAKGERVRKSARIHDEDESHDCEFEGRGEMRFDE